MASPGSPGRFRVLAGPGRDFSTSRGLRYHDPQTGGGRETAAPDTTRRRNRWTRRTGSPSAVPLSPTAPALFAAIHGRGRAGRRRRPSSPRARPGRAPPTSTCWRGMGTRSPISSRSSKPSTTSSSSRSTTRAATICSRLIAQSPPGTYDLILSDAEFVQQLNDAGYIEELTPERLPARRSVPRVPKAFRVTGKTASCTR